MDRRMSVGIGNWCKKHCKLLNMTKLFFYSYSKTLQFKHCHKVPILYHPKETNADSVYTKKGGEYLFS